MAEHDLDPNETNANVSRRHAMAKLGIAAVVAYAAPSVLRINRNVHAFMGSTACPQQDQNSSNNPPTCPP